MILTKFDVSITLTINNSITSKQKKRRKQQTINRSMVQERGTGKLSAVILEHIERLGGFIGPPDDEFEDESSASSASSASSSSTSSSTTSKDNNNKKTASGSTLDDIAAAAAIASLFEVATPATTTTTPTPTTSSATTTTGLVTKKEDNNDGDDSQQPPASKRAKTMPPLQQRKKVPPALRTLLYSVSWPVGVTYKRTYSCSFDNDLREISFQVDHVRDSSTLLEKYPREISNNFAVLAKGVHNVGSGSMSTSSGSINNNINNVLVLVSLLECDNPAVFVVDPIKLLAPVPASLSSSASSVPTSASAASSSSLSLSSSGINLSNMSFEDVVHQRMRELIPEYLDEFLTSLEASNDNASAVSSTTELKSKDPTSGLFEFITEIVVLVLVVLLLLLLF